MSYKCVFKVNFKGRKILFLPFFSISYLIIVLIVIFLILWFVEIFIVNRYEYTSELDSIKWQAENLKIKRNNEIKLDPIADNYYLWNSKCYKIAKQKTRKNRILVMGDSYVWGDGYSNMNDLWWRQLQWAMDRAGYDVEVIASGANGEFTQKQFKWAKKIILEYKPDLVIWGFSANNIEMRLADGSPYVRRFHSRVDSDLQQVYQTDFLIGFLKFISSNKYC